MATSTDVRKAQLRMARPSAGRAWRRGPNWPTKAGRHAAITSVPALDGVDQLENLALVSNGGEGAVDQAHAAGDALVIVDLGPAELVGADGVHAAGRGAGPLQS